MRNVATLESLVCSMWDSPMDAIVHAAGVSRKTIIRIGKRLGLPKRRWVRSPETIAKTLATRLANYGSSHTHAIPAPDKPITKPEIAMRGVRYDLQCRISNG